MTAITPATRKTGWQGQVGKQGTTSVPGQSTIQYPKVVDTANRPNAATLRFSPYAWAKFKYLRDKGSTEVAAFGISELDDPLAMIDILMIKQEASAAHVEFDDEAVSHFFEDQHELGRKPAQFARVWLHTHPGNCATPSGTDENTFTRVFGGCDWAVMAILARGGDLTARLRYNKSVRAEFQIKVEVDYSLPFGASDHEAWDKEYDNTLEIDTWVSTAGYGQWGQWGHWNNPDWNDHTPGIHHQNWKSPYANQGNREVGVHSQTPSARSIGFHAGPSINSVTVVDETQDELNSDIPEIDETYWTLETELKDQKPEDRIELLRQLQIGSDEIGDYVCHYDAEGTLIAELNPALFEPLDEIENNLLEPSNGGFTDQASTEDFVGVEELIMDGFKDEHLK
jgi:proteasome lid subunit RPN8/RPN11